MEKSDHLEGIKLVSFDIWKTLLDSNPEFRERRARALRAKLGVENVEIGEFSKTISKVDRELDAQSDKNGIQYGLKERLEGIYEQLPSDSRLKSLTDETINEIDDEIASLIAIYLPKLMENDLLETLEALKKRDIKVAVMSNTGFVNGRHMRVVLEKLGILPYVDVKLFSNEVGSAKPNKLIFEALLNESGYAASEILHIGDNYEADYQGAENAGLKGLHLTINESPAKRKIAKLSDLVK